MWSASNDYHDRWQYHAGAVASLPANVILRAGFFTARTADYNDYLDQDFLTAGVSWNVTPFLSASFAYLTSAPFVKDMRWSSLPGLHQQLLSGGIACAW